MSLRSEIINDLQTIENDLGLPTFTWQNNSYVFIPSITEFSRQLDTGGFQAVKLLTATVRKYNVDGSGNYQPIFTGGYPSPQNIISYTLDGTNYRIETIKHDSTNSYFRLIGHSTTKG